MCYMNTALRNGNVVNIIYRYLSVYGCDLPQVEGIRGVPAAGAPNEV